MVMHSKDEKIIGCSECGKGCLFKIIDKNIIEIKCPKCGEYVYYEIELPLTVDKKTDTVITK